MPSFNIIRESNPSNSFRVNSIKGQFDLSIDTVIETFKGEINLPTEWNIGVVSGSSGSGKSTIAKELWPNEYIEGFKYKEKSVVDDMPKECSPTEITKVFNSVGFATVWSWLKPYSVLSQGEKMRVDLARAILEKNELIVFDEFTSVVNREVAKHGSYAIQKSIRKKNKKFIAVTCHSDIIEWLEPDWIYDTDKQAFFFAQENTNDLKSNSILSNANQANGNVLKSIII